MCIESEKRERYYTISACHLKNEISECKKKTQESCEKKKKRRKQRRREKYFLFYDD